MGIFEKINKTVSDAGQKTMEKTRGVADTSRFNSMIVEEEKIISNLCYEIGKKYVSIYKDNPEEEFIELINEIKIAEKKISEYKIKIQDIKGIRICEKCGAEVEKGAIFCSHCGNKMPELKVPKELKDLKCKNCETPLKTDMKFCIACGNPIDWSEMMIANGESDDDIIKFCNNCGSEIESGFAFCVQCGKKLI